MSRKQKIQAAASLIILVILIAALFGLKAYNKNEEKQQSEAEEAAKVYVNQIKAEDITALSWTQNDTTWHLTKTDDTWTCTEQPDDTLDTAQVQTLLDAIAGLEATQKIENPEDDTTYGFDTPATTITCTTPDTTTTILVGNENTITGGNYVKEEGTDNVYLVSTTLPTTFDCDPTTLVKTEESEASETSEVNETN